MCFPLRDSEYWTQRDHPQVPGRTLAWSGCPPVAVAKGQRTRTGFWGVWPILRACRRSRAVWLGSSGTYRLGAGPEGTDEKIAGVQGPTGWLRPATRLLPLRGPSLRFRGPLLSLRWRLLQLRGPLLRLRGPL